MITANEFANELQKPAPESASFRMATMPQNTPQNTPQTTEKNTWKTPKFTIKLNNFLARKPLILMAL